MANWQPVQCLPYAPVKRTNVYAMLSVHWSIKICRKLVTAPLCLFRNRICIELLQKQKEKHNVTIAAPGPEEHMRITLIVARIISFYYLMCYSRLCILFRRISGSRFTWIRDFNSLTALSPFRREQKLMLGRLLAS